MCGFNPELLRDDGTARNNELNRISDRHIEHHQLLLGNHDQKPRCGIGGGRYKDVADVFFGFVLRFAVGAIGQKTDGIQMLARKTHQNRLLENGFFVFPHRIRNLLHRVVDGTDERNFLDKTFRQREAQASEEEIGEPSERRDEQHDNQHRNDFRHPPQPLYIKEGAPRGKKQSTCRFSDFLQKKLRDEKRDPQRHQYQQAGNKSVFQSVEHGFIQCKC